MLQQASSHRQLRWLHAPSARHSAVLRASLLAAGSVLVVDSAIAQRGLTPATVFIQAGSARHTHEISTGVTWDWARQWTVGGGSLSGYYETSISEWSYPDTDGRRSAWLGQVGLIPVFRYRPAGGTAAWFMEGGVGITFTTTLYETERKRFSTSFNFGDHIAVGRNFGERREHEISLRVEHFSNAGIKHPNPGENFLQIRYSYRFQ